MASPVTPSQLADAIPNSTMDQCEALSKALLQFPTLVHQIFEYMFQSNGVPTATFAKDLSISKPGDIIMSAAPLAEDSTRLLANGQTVSRETYANLFAALGTTYGAGDGSTTFQLPDYSDRFPRAVGSDITLGEQGGADTIELDPDQLPAAGGVFGIGSVTGVVLAVSAGGTYDATAAGSTHRTGTWQGTGAEIDIQPKSMGAFFYVKT